MLMFIAIKLNCRMSQLMIQLKVNTETLKFIVCIYSRENLMTLTDQKNSASLKGVLQSHDDSCPPSPPGETCVWKRRQCSSSSLGVLYAELDLTIITYKSIA